MDKSNDQDRGKGAAERDQKTRVAIAACRVSWAIVTKMKS